MSTQRRGSGAGRELWLRAVALAAALAVWVGTSGEARALDWNPPGSRGAALSGAMAAAAVDGYGVWYNSALLTLSEDFAFGIQYSAIHPSIDVTVEQYGSLGFIPYMQAVDDGGALSSSKTKLRVDRLFGKEAQPEALQNLNMEVLLPLQRMIPRFPVKVGLGMLISIPCAGVCLVQVSAHTPDQPFFPVYGDRVQRLHALFGVGVELVEDWVSVGVAASVFSDMQGSVASLTPIATFDPEHPEEDPAPPSKATFSQDLGTTVAPQFGLLVRPAKTVNVGGYYRFPQKLDLKFEVDAGVSVDMGFPFEARMPYFLESTFFYVPASTGASVAWTLWDSLLLTAQVDVVFWSELATKTNVSDFGVEPEAENDAGGLTSLAEYGDFRVRSLAVPRIHVRDTISPKAGIEYALKGGFTKFRVGYAYVPSALAPDQQYDNLLLDNSYHTISGGLGFALRDPLDYLALPVQFDLHAAVSLLQPRYNHVGLSDPDAGYHAVGVVKSEGTFFSFGIDATLRL